MKRVKRPAVTMHGVGWAIALTVNLLTLWVILHNGHL